MYLHKRKAGTNFYRNFEPKFTKYSDVETEVHIANAISDDMSRKMHSTIRAMTTMIVHEFYGGKK